MNKDDNFGVSYIWDMVVGVANGLGVTYGELDEEGNLVYTPPVVEDQELPWPDPGDNGEGGDGRLEGGDGRGERRAPKGVRREGVFVLEPGIA